MTSAPYVLGCCLIDEGVSLDAAIQSGLRPADFETAAHGAVFRHLCAMRAEKIPIGLDTLLPRMNGEADAVELMALDQIGTTTHFKHHLKELQSESAKRRLVGQARQVIQKYEDGAGVEDLVPLFKIDLPASADALLTDRAYDHGRRHPKPKPIYTAKGTTICTPGNLTTLYAQTKVGKSALQGGMLAASMVDPGASDSYDCLGMVGPNPLHHAVIHLDTEQSPYDWQQSIGIILRRAKMDAPPAWFMSYNLTGLPAPECRRVLETLLAQARKQHKGVHSVHIDGIGDFVIDPNSSEECFPLITRLHGLAIEYSTSIINVLHLNPGSEEKGRGHLGSQLERKSESNIMMESKDGISSYWGTKQRGKPISKSDAIAFQWSDEAQMHVSVQAPESQRKPGGRSRAHTIQEFWECIPAKGATPMTGTALHRYAAQVAEIKPNTFKDLLADATKEGLLTRTYDAKTGFSYARAL